LSGREENENGGNGGTVVGYPMSTRLFWEYMGYIWDIYGIYMGYIWDIYGIYMGYIWDIYGIYMGYIWDIYIYGIYCIRMFNFWRYIMSNGYSQLGGWFCR